MDNHPDSLAEYHERVFNIILEYGHVVQYVTGERPFAYTVGRTMKRRPELLITGPFPPETAEGVLNAAVAVDDETPIVAGELVHGALEGGFQLLAMEADPRLAQLFVARATFGDIEALQLLWPDRTGKFPTDPGCSHGDLQPLFRKE